MAPQFRERVVDVPRRDRLNVKRVQELLGLGIRDGSALGFLERHASELSGGEAQIVALIRVLQLAPQVLLLDEPTASLDPESALASEALITAWFDASATARAWVWVSHDTAQAARVGRRQLTMRAGVLGAPAPESPAALPISKESAQ